MAKKKAKRKPKRSKPKAKKEERLKPMSLHPLTFDEAMRRIIDAPAESRKK